MSAVLVGHGPRVVIGSLMPVDVQATSLEIAGLKYSGFSNCMTPSPYQLFTHTHTHRHRHMHRQTQTHAQTERNMNIFYALFTLPLGVSDMPVYCSGRPHY
jgi:hypothetical protein